MINASLERTEPYIALKRGLPTHVPDPGPVHRWFQFKESFSPQLVHAILDELALGPGHLLLDPFCGAGTALLVAAERGLRVAGCDLLPLAIFASRVKLTPFSPEAVTRGVGEVLRTASGPPRETNHFVGPASVEYRISPGKLNTDLPPGVRCPWFFTPPVYAQLLDLRKRILALGAVGDALLLGLVAIVDQVDLAFKDGAFLSKIRPERPSSGRRKRRQELFARQRATLSDDVLGAWERKMAEVVADLAWRDAMVALDVIQPMRQDLLVLADARRLRLAAQFDAIITSPPYANRYDYTRIYQPELTILLGGGKAVAQLRRSMLCSTTEARPLPPAPDYAEPRRLRELLEQLKERGVEGKVVAMLRGYFSDVFHALRGMSASLRPGGALCLVVGTSSYRGVTIPVDRLLAELGERTRLCVAELVPLRARGTSAQQAKRYGRRQQRETLVVYRKAAGG